MNKYNRIHLQIQKNQVNDTKIGIDKFNLIKTVKISNSINIISKFYPFNC